MITLDIRTEEEQVKMEGKDFLSKMQFNMYLDENEVINMIILMA